MFNVGGGEFLVIAVLALIVLGPQRLPDAARRVGQFLNELKTMSAGFQRELESALEDVDPAAKAAVKKHVIGRVPGSSSPLAKGLSTAVAAVSAQADPSGDDAPSDDGAAPKNQAQAPEAVAKQVRKRPATKASATKAPARKAAATKRVATKATTKKATAKQPTKKAPTKKASTTKAPAKRAGR
jgi:Tat protein translocase TatB subunit